MPEKRSRRAVNFDLVGELLQKYYPKSNPKQAYFDIERFMTKHNFEHRQWSGYCSVEKLTRPEFISVLEDMIRQMPWLAYCVRRFDVTDIGDTFDLLPIMTDMEKVRTTQNFNIKKCVFVSKEQLQTLSKSGMRFEMKKAPDGRYIIKYKASDEKQVKKLLSEVKKQCKPHER